MGGRLGGTGAHSGTRVTHTSATKVALESASASKLPGVHTGMTGQLCTFHLSTNAIW